MGTSLFLSVFLLKLLKKRPRAALHVTNGFMSSEKPVIKICMNASLRLVFTVVGIVGKGDSLNLFLFLLKWVGGHICYFTCPHHSFLLSLRHFCRAGKLR